MFARHAVSAVVGQVGYASPMAATPPRRALFEYALASPRRLAPQEAYTKVTKPAASPRQTSSVASSRFQQVPSVAPPNPSPSVSTTVAEGNGASGARRGGSVSWCMLATHKSTSRKRVTRPKCQGLQCHQRLHHRLLRRHRHRRKMTKVTTHSCQGRSLGSSYLTPTRETCALPAKDAAAGGLPSPSYSGAAGRLGLESQVLLGFSIICLLIIILHLSLYLDVFLCVLHSCYKALDTCLAPSSRHKVSQPRKRLLQHCMASAGWA